MSAQPWLWARYVRFVRLQLKSAEKLEEVTRRAVRHCAGSIGLWVERLRALEAINAAPEEVQAAFESSLGAPLAADGDEGDEGDGDATLCAAAGAAHYGGSSHVRMLLVYSQYQRRRALAAMAAASDGGSGASPISAMSM